jgi:hypothetical protein
VVCGPSEATVSNNLGGWRTVAIGAGLLAGVALATGMYVVVKIVVGEVLAHVKTARAT